MSDTTHREYQPEPPTTDRPAWADALADALARNTEALDRNTRAQADRSVAEDHACRGL